MEVQQNNNIANVEEGSLNLREYISYCQQHWRWFVVSVVSIVAVTVLYLLMKAPVYERSTNIMIKDNDPGGNITAGLSAFQGLGFFGGSSNVNNELAAMQTPSVMLEVVKCLKLDYNYSTREFLRRTPLYGQTLPINVEISGLTDEDAAMLKLKLNHGKLRIWKLRKNKTRYGDEVTGEVNKPIKSPIGTITVRTTPAYRGDEDMTISIQRRQPYEQAESQRKILMAGLDDELAQVISLSYQDASPERAIDILNTLIKVYNEDWMRDKNDLNAATSRFIDGRLEIIEKELGHVEEDITEYKSRNMIPDIAEVSRLYMEKSDQNNDLLVQLNSQMYMASYVRDYLKDNSNKNELLPANLIINDQNIEQQIVDYNRLQLERNKLALGSSEDNPIVLDMDKQLKSMRQAVLATIDNVVKQIRIQINGLTKSEQKNLNWIESSPAKAKHLLSAERQQKVQETLYIFLLQKREENVLSQAFTAYNTRILTPPMGSVRPVAPRKMIILASALAVAMLLPAIILFLIMNMDVNVRSARDLDSMRTPFLGTLGKKDDGLEHVCRNLTLLKPSSVLLTTMGNKGTPPHTILALAEKLSAQGKCTIAVDLDLRHGALSKSVGAPMEGAADYLSGVRQDWRQLVAKHGGTDVLPAGAIPPNPTDLLSGERLKQLTDSLCQQYDYVLIDGTPINKGDDAQLIAQATSLTVFTIRKGRFERQQLPVLDAYHDRLNTAVLLVNS